MGQILELGIALYDLADDQSDWSQKTFGTDAERGPVGACRHLAKEAVEAEHSVATEWFGDEMADCLLLVLDAARRGGIGPMELLRLAQLKMKKNRARTWPTPNPDGITPVEHVRD